MLFHCSSNTALRLTAVLLFLSLPNFVFAQAKVRESGAVVSGQVPAAPVQSTAPTGGVSRLAPQSFDPSSQLQLLQDEIMSLRGLVEEQAFEIKRLKQQRIDDYLDLDKRIVALQSELSAVPSPPAGQQSLLTSPVIPLSNGSDQLGEKKLYNDAIDLLLDKQDYAGSKENFENYLTTYPNGIYSANVHYWLGQIFLTENDQTAAEESFVQITDNYPSHQKAPDAKFKLAKIYFDRGDKEKAKILMDDLASGQTDTASLAKAFIQQNF